ncbi:hypothetical protein FHS18_001324 [Paenibacillus phyllosphaerae]|uniref:Nucleotidyl transferase AbiEii toxin, Type IV TA system n=1 Tax=Paenibacillus phyllosphaerae TaxID=274593 RepID=A0A7W5FLQ3_9BACL|nr:hypothetical protein [Paenibacillus phyllosphaerae]MBB3109272.1 hypothetical protein [Paenibacillus phyllosphaerae]
MEEKDTIRLALSRIAEAVDGTGATWLVGGSAGLMLRGLPLTVPPRDLDLYADLEDAAIIHERLKRYAVDDPHLSVSPIYRSVLSHYEIEGISVELVGGFEVTASHSHYRVEARRVLNPHRFEIAVGHHHVSIVPLAHELWFNVLRQREDRIESIAAAIRNDRTPHLEGLDAVEAHNAFPQGLLEAVHERIGIGPGGQAHES